MDRLLSMMLPVAPSALKVLSVLWVPPVVRTLQQPVQLVHTPSRKQPHAHRVLPARTTIKSAKLTVKFVVTARSMSSNIKQPKNLANPVPLVHSTRTMLLTVPTMIQVMIAFYVLLDNIPILGNSFVTDALLGKKR